MMFKKKDKKEREKDEFAARRKEDIDKIVQEVYGRVDYNIAKNPDSSSSSDYESFKKDQKGRKLTVYERLCSRSEKLFKISPDEKSRVKMERAIELTHMKVTSEGATSFSLMTGAALFVAMLLGWILGLYGFTSFLILLMLDLGVIFTLFKYPESVAKTFRIQASSEIILAIIYMVIYMRSSPNMEGAIRFAAQNLTGPLADDFKTIMWEVETKQNLTLNKALDNYLDRWDDYPEFRESISLIVSSMAQPDERRLVMLDEAVSIILSGTKERMTHYSQNLRMPILAIHALGIMLPILVLIMFPIIILLLEDAISPITLVVFYDVALPIGIYYLSRRILANRPISFGVPDISIHPKYAGLGKVKIFNRPVTLWPFTLGLSVVALAASLLVVVPIYSNINFTAMFLSLLIPWSIAIGLIVHYFMDTRLKMDIRNQIKKMQEEFAEALFRLAGSMSLGIPFEKAIEDAVRKSPDLSITVMFKNVLKNVKQGGLSFEAAFFDKKYGAVWDFPSKIVINVMRIILQATKKSVRIASVSAMSISRYLKQLKDMDEYIKDMLSETTSAMKFLSIFLAPFIAGVTVTMASIMMRIFERLGQDLATLEGASTAGFNTLLIGGFGQNSEILPIAGFTIIVGIYVIESIWLLTNLSSGVENGPFDKIQRRYSTAWALLIGLIIYTLSILITHQIFGAQIETLFVR